MNEMIDVALVVAKLAAIKNEKAKIVVGGTSLIYNVTQIARLKAMLVELYQLCNCIMFQVRVRGKYTQAEYDLCNECGRQIEELYNEIVKYGTMSFIDGVSLLINGFKELTKM